MVACSLAVGAITRFDEPTPCLIGSTALGAENHADASRESMTVNMLAHEIGFANALDRGPRTWVAVDSSMTFCGTPVDGVSGS